MLEPYALKGACTVLRGGKPERAYLSRVGATRSYALQCGEIPLALVNELSLPRQAWLATTGFGARGTNVTKR